MKKVYIIALASISSLVFFNSMQAQAAENELSQSEQVVQPDNADSTAAPPPLPAAGADLPPPPAPLQPGSTITPAEESNVDQQSQAYQDGQRILIEQANADAELKRQQQAAAHQQYEAELRRQAAAQAELERLQAVEEARRQTEEVAYAQSIEPRYTQPQTSYAQPQTRQPESPTPKSTNPSPKKVELVEVNFLCGEDGGTPATVAKAKDSKQFFVILWKSDVFKQAGYDAATRCKQVSARFEEFNKANLFTYLTSGKLNGQPVICLTGKADGACGDDSVSLKQGLLFTLKPDENSNQTLEALATVLQSENGSTQEPLEQ